MHVIEREVIVSPHAIRPTLGEPTRRLVCSSQELDPNSARDVTHHVFCWQAANVRWLKLKFDVFRCLKAVKYCRQI